MSIPWRLDAEGNVDADAQAEAGSQLVFEWEVQTDYGFEVYTSYMKCEMILNVLKRDIKLRVIFYRFLS